MNFNKGFLAHQPSDEYVPQMASTILGDLPTCPGTETPVETTGVFTITSILYTKEKKYKIIYQFASTCSRKVNLSAEWT